MYLILLEFRSMPREWRVQPAKVGIPDNSVPTVGEANSRPSSTVTTELLGSESAASPINYHSHAEEINAFGHGLYEDPGDTIIRQPKG